MRFISFNSCFLLKLYQKAEAILKNSYILIHVYIYTYIYVYIINQNINYNINTRTCIMAVRVDLKSFKIHYFLQPLHFDFNFCNFPVEARVVRHHVFQVDWVFEVMLDKPVESLLQNLHNLKKNNFIQKLFFFLNTKK